ncbi:MAG: polymerase tau subunit [Geobacteraceae bacterium]|nr:polymerase tau subunit [Geobacteraceae bacterium]
MSYLVLARKWRPQTFSDLVGQEHISRTLQNAIESGRVAHAFLFTGARGVGKTSAARILAKALDCEKGPSAEPCNACPACTSITAGNAVDVFEIDGASNTGVEDIRELRENIKYLPSSFRFKIFIIDEVHMLSTNAFNALLKTLEEPPAHVKFIFATTEPHKVPVTILSRCQRFDFKRIPLQKIVARLRHIAEHEQIAISDEALTTVARKGDGSMRDSLSTMDQVLAFCGNTVSDEEVVSLLGVVDRRLLLDTSRTVFSGNRKSALETVKKVDDFGYNMRQFCQELIGHFRNLTIVNLVDDPRELLDLAEAELNDIKEQAQQTRQEDLHRHLSILLKAENEMAQSGFARLILEIALVKMCSLAPVVPVREILERLKAIEEGRVLPAIAAKPSHRPKPAPEQPTSTRNERNGVEPASISAVAPSEAKGSWTGFVALVLEKKVSLGSLLEHGHPLQFSPLTIKIGFPPDSFYLTALKDPDSISALKELAQHYLKAQPTIEIIALSAGAKDIPPSEMEKKHLQMNERTARVEQAGRSHPMVSAALEVFGGEISDIREIEEDTPEKK